MSEAKLELAYRPATTITHDNGWVYIKQVDASGEVDTIALHQADLKAVIDFLCDITGAGTSLP